MNVQELNTMGYYEPGFFHLRVNIDTEIKDLNEFAKDPNSQHYFSTFLHEYIHFLQEITTTSGILKAGALIDLIKDINWKIRHDGKSDFTVPVVIDNKSNSEANRQLEIIYRGSNDPVDYAKYAYYKFDEISVADKDGNIKKPKKYTVYYYTKYGQLSSFHFGYICLKEFVAHTIQKQYLATVEHADIPYLIAELIISSEYPPLATNPLLIVSFCDACLMSFHPADIFFHTLERMKNDSYLPISQYSVCQYVWEGIYFQDEKEKLTIWDLYAKISKFTIDQISDALASNIFHSNKEWLHHIILEAINLRINQPTFMTELVKSDGNLTSLFYTVVKRIGTPFFTNSKNQGVFIPPENTLSKKF